MEIARDSIARHVAGRPRIPRHLEDSGPVPWGVFVSLHGPAGETAEGPLRGCIGSLDLHSTSVEKEVAKVAVSSATSDPRFPPLGADEIGDLAITVYLLHTPETVGGPEDLDPRRFGIIVTGRGGRRGLLLPALPGIDDPEQQLDLATRKAGLSPGSKITIERFTADILH